MLPLQSVWHAYMLSSNYRVRFQIRIANRTLQFHKSFLRAQNGKVPGTANRAFSRISASVRIARVNTALIHKFPTSFFLEIVVAIEARLGRMLQIYSCSCHAILLNKKPHPFVEEVFLFMKKIHTQ